MNSQKERFLGKVKSTVSSLYGIVMCVTRLSYLLEASKALPAYHCLGSLICSTAENLNHGACIIHSYMISPLPRSLSSSSSSSSSYSSSFSSLFEPLPHSSSSWSSGDLIGTESGVMSSTEDTLLIEELQKPKPYTCSSTARSKRNQRCEMKREYPPPIPSLAADMPSVLTRNYVNGRLVLREERLQKYEYLESKRENGRLLLKMHLFCHEVYETDEDVKLEDLYMNEDHDDKEIIADYYDDAGCHDHVKDNIDEDSNIGDDDYDDDDEIQPKCLESAFSIPESCREIESVREEDLQFYADRKMMNSSFFRMAIPT